MIFNNKTQPKRK